MQMQQGMTLVWRGVIQERCVSGILKHTSWIQKSSCFIESLGCGIWHRNEQLSQWDSPMRVKLSAWKPYVRTLLIELLPWALLINQSKWDLWLFEGEKIILQVPAGKIIIPPNFQVLYNFFKKLIWIPFFQQLAFIWSCIYVLNRMNPLWKTSLLDAYIRRMECSLIFRDIYIYMYLYL